MSQEYKSIIPSPQERLLQAATTGAYETVVFSLVSGLNKGRSPSFLSMLRTDSLVGIAQAWRSMRIDTGKDAAPLSYKTVIFDALKPEAEEGNPAAIEALSKFTTSPDRLDRTLELVLAYDDQIAEWHADRSYMQYSGTFDPQHIGHRIAILSALQTAGERSSTVIQVMGGHPFKTNITASYEDRYQASEEKLYKSSLLDNLRITQVDVPGNIGLGVVGLEQMKLLANASGDSKLRWLVGSDKFLLDVSSVQSAYPSPKALMRFAEPNMHMYVHYRVEDNLDLLQHDMDFVRDRFGTAITLVPDLPYDCAPASSTRIKELRAAGRDGDADFMEFYELRL